MCPWHWYRFDAYRRLRHPAPLRVHPVVQRDSALFADVGDRPVRRSLSELLRSHARGES